MMVATPVVLEQTFFHSGRALTQRFIASYGTTHMVANAASSIVYNIGAAPSNALTTATLTIIGMCIGRERIDLAKEYTNKFVRTTTILCLIVLIPIFPFTALINRLYNVTAEAAVLTYMAVGVFHIGAPLFMGRHTIVPSALRSGGDAVFTSLVALLSMWLVRVTLALLFTRVLSMGVVGVISAMVLEWGVRGVVFGARYKTDKWYRHSIIIRE
jgi:Na+-driven multidrug efflux pump